MSSSEVADRAVGLSPQGSGAEGKVMEQRFSLHCFVSLLLWDIHHRSQSVLSGLVFI